MRVSPWVAGALIPLALVAGLATRARDDTPPMPEVNLGVMKSCAHIGALARGIALDKAQGRKLNAARYREYQAYLTSRRTLFRSPDLALLLAYGARGLEPEVIRNLGVQTCVAAYYGFRDGRHRKALYQEALACQRVSGGEPQALDDCMGREYQGLLRQWWKARHGAAAATSL